MKPWLAVPLKKRPMAWLSLGGLLLLSAQAFAQLPSLQPLIDSVNARTLQLGKERLYLQLDRPYYALGDTLYFKAYLFEEASLAYSKKSGIAYLEVADDSNHVVKRLMLPVVTGLSWGNLTLEEKDFHEGGYTLRAYTNYQRNFAAEAVFTQHFYLVDNRRQPWLVNAQTRVVKQEDKEQAQVSLQVRELNGQPLVIRPLTVRLLEGSRVRSRDQVQTDELGQVKLEFPLSSKAGASALALSLDDPLPAGSKQHLQFPLIVTHPEQVDVQFLPEGGALVAGIASRLGIKAVGEDGKGVAVSGEIFNSRQQKVAQFTTAHKGMGSFEFTPQPSESYLAQVRLANGSVKSYPFPLAKASGTTLRVVNPRQSDSLEIVVRTAGAGASPLQVYRLVAQVRDRVYYGALVSSAKPTTKIRVAKTAFPSGIVHVSLLTPTRQPLNERLTYLDHGDELAIQLSPSQPAYAKRDSVALQLEVKDQNGTPIQGSFSVSVTDDSRVKADSMSDNLLSRVLLTAELKGHVEEPSHYLNAHLSDQTWQELDNLLLTQGWVSYEWSTEKKLAYEAEEEFTVKGKVTNIANQAVEKTNVVLFSQKPLLVKDTVTSATGSFTFTGLYPVDTAAFAIQARNKKGKSFGISVEVDAFQPPLFPASQERVMPWYFNSDSSKLQVIQQEIISRKEQEKLAAGSHLLTEVVVTAKKIVQGTKNLNGPGEADQILTQQEIEKMGKVTLGQLLEKRISGVQRTGGRYMIGYKRMHLVIDGFDIDPLRDVMYPGPPPMPWDDFYQGYFDFFTAEDIVGIEMMSSLRYNTFYQTRFPDVAEPIVPNTRFRKIGPDENVLTRTYAYLEITTRSGAGPYLRRTPGTYLYKPLPFSLPKQFYRPRYPVKEANPFPDQRATIHWEPNIMTDEEGKATISFYSADLPGQYHITVEGTDLNGHLGSTRRKLSITP